MKRYRLAILATHPIQYQAHWFRALADSADIELHVFFCRQTGGQDQARAGFGVEFEWDVPLLEGYAHTFLRNVSSAPGVNSFRGLNTPEIAQELRADRFDALLIYGWFFQSAWQAVRAAKRQGIPVMALSDSTLLEPRSALRRMAKQVAYPRLLGRFDACLAAGTRARQYLLHYGVPAARIFFVPHSVDQPRLEEAAREAGTRRAALRSAWGLRPDSMVALFAGKLIPLKRALDFVEAVALASRANGGIEGLIAGDGPERAAAERRVAGENIPVRFAGFLNQSAMAEAYTVCDVLVLPSGQETWGMVANEAMTCGRPCLVSDRAGCSADLIMEGETGYVFPAGDVAALGALLQKMAADPATRQEMGHKARAFMRKYSTDTAVAGVREALRSIIPRKS